jgi:hypothetical protein
VLSASINAQTSGYWSAVRTVGAAIHPCLGARADQLPVHDSVAHAHTNVLPRYLDDPGPHTKLPDQAFTGARPLDPAELPEQLTRLKAVLR